MPGEILIKNGTAESVLLGKEVIRSNIGKNFTEIRSS